MNTWLTAIFTSVSVGALGCGYSSATSSGTGQGNFSVCYGPGCANSANAAVGGSSPAGSTSLVVPDTDAGSTWSPLCGPQNVGCLPDPDAGTCGDIYADQSPLDGGVDAGAGSDGSVGKTAIGTLTCRIRPVADTHAIERACEAAGAGVSGDPCRSTVDCESGLTCVAEDLTGLCRPYCCADPESCPSNSYCATRSTLISKDPWVLGSDVPVCSVAENCPLTDTYPCPPGQNCTCPSGKACMVVRRHGLTACVKPGSGMQGDYCPCAAGYVCSNSTFTCLKLCPLPTSNASTVQGASTCITGTSCQASNDVPADWGVCSNVPMLIN